MKTTVLHTAILTLLSSSTLHALGLGDMKVHSYLNQPFHGEIELIDVKGISLSSIKASLASVEDYEHVGIEQGYAVNLLRFSIGKNKQGNPVIILQSSERITDPYMQLLVDLAWPDGQLYREYNILLDPPGYQLGSSTVYGGRVTRHRTASGKQQPGVVDKTIISHVVHSPDTVGETREQSTYGPVKADEDIWQIAQRYKTENVNLQQLVLGIVGMTPEAFENANLNGLKVGSKLTIPSSQTVQKIPPILAKQEVNAHEEAWKNKSEIKHVLLPPYSEGEKPELSPLETSSTIPSIVTPSEIPPVSENPVTPETSEAAQRKPETRGLMSSVMSATALFIPEEKTADPAADLNAVKQASDADLKTRAEISVATSAVESVKDANVILNEELKILREQNQKLQAHIEHREKDLSDLRAKIDLLLKERQSVSSQAYAAKDAREEPRGTWPFWLLFLILAGGGGFLLWYFYGRPPEDQDPDSLPPNDVIDEKSKDKAAFDENVEEKNAPADIDPSDNESTEEALKPADELQATEEEPASGATDKPITMEIEDDIDESALEELSVPVLTPQTESDTALASEEDIEEEISDSLSTDIEEEKAIKDEMQDMDFKEQKKKSAEAKEEIISEEDVSSGKNETLNSTLEEPLETAVTPSSSKEYEQDRGFKRPLSSLGELEIDEIPPVQTRFEPTPDIELPEIDIKELDNYTSESEATEPEVKEIKAKDVEPPVPLREDEKPEEDQLKEEPQDEFVLDFEPGLYQPEEETITEDISEEDISATPKDSEQVLEFVLEEDKIDLEPEIKENATGTFSEQEQETKKEEADTSKTEPEQTDSLANPLKSKAALDTLLALAKTYIGMDDIEAARQSLQEVAENGDKEQKAEAQQLLDELDKN